MISTDQGTGWRVVLVDDEPSVINLMNSVLQHYFPHLPTLAYESADLALVALDALYQEAAWPHHTILITDFHTQSQFNGADLVEEWLKRGANSDYIFMASGTWADAVADLRKRRLTLPGDWMATHVVGKPVRPITWAQLLRPIIDPSHSS